MKKGVSELVWRVRQILVLGVYISVVAGMYVNEQPLCIIGLLLLQIMTSLMNMIKTKILLHM